MGCGAAADDDTAILPVVCPPREESNDNTRKMQGHDSSRGIEDGGPSISEQAAKLRAGFTAPRNSILATGGTLAACAGMVNVVAWLQLGSFVSHVSGNVSHIGMHAEGLHAGLDTPADLGESVLLLAAFMSGAAICGLASAREQIQVGQALNGFALVGNALLLILSFCFAQYRGAKFCAAAACGLQNSMCTVYFGPMCRTTHLTGLATDAGTTMGRLTAVVLRNRCFLRSLDELDRAEVAIQLAKLRIYTVLGLSFLTGAACGAWLSRWLGASAFLIPAGVTGAMGTTYLLLQRCLWMGTTCHEQHDVRHMTSDCSAQGEEGINDELDTAEANSKLEC